MRINSRTRLFMVIIVFQDAWHVNVLVLQIVVVDAAAVLVQLLMLLLLL